MDVKSREEIIKFAQKLNSTNLSPLRSGNISLKVQKNNGNLLKFEGFRSLCPVTFQPDFATIYIQHKSEVTPSKEIIDHLLTYRTKGEFHERCIEDICSHLSLSFNLKSLTVIGRFMRRGGIDINPIRSLAKKYPKKNIHDTFQ